MSTEPAPLTVFDAVQKAVKACDPSGNDAGLGELLVRFEDDDEPIGDPAVTEQRIAEELGALDPQAEDPALQVAAAVATYLAYRRAQAGDHDAHLIRLAVKAEYDDAPPENVRQWLA